MKSDYGQRTCSIQKHGYDTKFAMHLVRLVWEGEELLKTCRLVFPLPFAEHLLAIRRGEWKLDYIIESSKNALESLQNCSSPLPDKPDLENISKLQQSLIEAFWMEEEKEELCS